MSRVRDLERGTDDVMLLLRRQRRSASASCAGLQSRQLHADTGIAGGGQTLIADQLAGETRQDRREDRHARALRHLPDGGSRRAEPIVRRNSEADRWTTAATGPGLRAGIVRCIRTTGGVCLNVEKTVPQQPLEHVLARKGTLVEMETTHPASGSVKNALLSAPIRAHPGNVG